MMYTLIYLIFGIVFVAYGLFHLWQRGQLQDRDLSRAFIRHT